MATEPAESKPDGRRNNRPPISPGRPPGRTSPPGMRALQGIVRKQIEIYKFAQVELLDSIAERKRKDPDSKATEGEVATRQEITEFLFRTSPSLIKLSDALSKATSGASTEQLEAQIKAEFVRLVPTFSVEEWAEFCAVRERSAA